MYTYDGVDGSWFPIKVRYEDGRVLIINHPDQIENGKPFRVLTTRVKNHE